jgi:hypothetical protein
MPNPPIPAAGEAMPAEGQEISTSPEELALVFVACLRLAGHRAHVDQSGRFGITLNVAKPTRAPPEHHLGPDHAYLLGFDDRPFAALLKDPDYIAKLIAATRKMGDC